MNLNNNFFLFVYFFLTRDAHPVHQRKTPEGEVALEAKLKTAIAKKSQRASEALAKLNEWQEKNSPVIDDLKGRSEKLQSKLKALCACIRNE